MWMEFVWSWFSYRIHSTDNENDKHTSAEQLMNTWYFIISLDLWSLKSNMQTVIGRKGSANCQLTLSVQMCKMISKSTATWISTMEKHLNYSSKCWFIYFSKCRINIWIATIFAETAKEIRQSNRNWAEKETCVSRSHVELLRKYFVFTNEISILKCVFFGNFFHSRLFGRAHILGD